MLPKSPHADVPLLGVERAVRRNSGFTYFDSVHGWSCRSGTPASFTVSTAGSLYQTFKQTQNEKKINNQLNVNVSSWMPTLALCVGPSAQPPVNIYLPHCTSCSPFTLIVAVLRMLMVPPTGCVSTMILPPTRHSLIVNRTAAATVRSLLSENHKVFVPPGPMRLISCGRLMMALGNVQQGGSTPSQQDCTRHSKCVLNCEPLDLPQTLDNEQVWLFASGVHCMSNSLLLVNSVVCEVEWNKYPS